MTDADAPRGRTDLIELPLIDRIINDAIRSYITVHMDTVMAASEEDEAAATRRAISRVCNGFEWTLTPRIVDRLRRANLLRAPEPGPAETEEADQ